MKTSSFIVSFALLGIISLVVWGCGGWFGRKNNKQQQHAQTDTAGQVAKADTMAAAVDSAWLKSPDYYRFKKDNLLLRSITDYAKSDEMFRHFKQDPPITVDDLFGKYKAALGLGPDDEMRLWGNTSPIPNGYSASYQQYYKGLPVAYAFYRLTVKDGKVLSGRNSLVPGLNLEIPVRLSQAEAFERAIEYGHKKGVAFRWENAVEEESLKKSTGDPNATNYPQRASLQIWADPPPYVHLAHVIYFIHLNAISPSAVFNVYVDANSGEVLLFEDNTVHACSPGLVATEYGGYAGTASKTYGQKTFKTVFNAPLNAYTLYTDPSDPSCYGHLIRTRIDADSLPTSNEIQNSPPNSNDWLSGTSNELATAHWAAQACYDYYQTEHNISTYNENQLGNPINIRLGLERVVPGPVGITSSDFSASPPRANIRIAEGGIGNILSNTCAWNDIYSLDLIGHEYTHVIDLVGNKLAWWKPSMPNPEALIRSSRLLESFCDVFGMVIENSVNGTNDWTFLNDVTNCDKVIRSAQSPNSYGYHIDDSGNYIQGQSSFYAQKTAYDCIYVRPTDEDEYSNTSILAHWLYYIVNGTGSSGPVTGFYTVAPLDPNTSIAMNKAAQIAYNLFTNVDPLIDDYHQLAKTTIDRATNVYGACSPEVQTVWDAWNAVNVHIALPVGCTWAVNPAAYDIPNYDYHVPYISSIRVEGQDATGYSARYWGDWRWNSTQSQLDFYHKQFKNIDFTEKALVSVETNDPLSSLTFEGILSETTGIFYDVATYFPPDLINTPPQSGISNRHTDYSLFWTFDIDGLNTISASPQGYRLVFSGTDLAGNSLIMLKNIATFPASFVLHPYVPSTSLPQRSSLSNLFAPSPTGISGQDNMHLLTDCNPVVPDNGICDNHLPYLQKIDVQQLGLSLSIQEWVSDVANNTLCLSNDFPSAYISLSMGEPFEIIVTASEPLAELNLERIALGSIIYTISEGSSLQQTNVLSNETNTQWTFTLNRTGDLISNNYYADGSNDYHFYFTGLDLAGNPLEVLQNYPEYDPEAKCLPLDALPVLNGDGIWSAQYSGTDKAFVLGIDYCPEDYYELSSYLTSDHAIPPYCLWVQPVDQTEPFPTSYTIWDNNSGQIVADLQDIPVNYPTDTYYDEYEPLDIAIPDFVTWGILPENYTMVVTMGNNCPKAYTGSFWEFDCILPTLGNITYNLVNDTDHDEYSLAELEFDLSSLNCPCELSVGNGSIGYSKWENLMTENAATFPLLDSEANNAIPCAISDVNGCVSFGILQNSTYVGIDCEYSSLHISLASDALACVGETICLPFTAPGAEVAYSNTPNTTVSFSHASSAGTLCCAIPPDYPYATKLLHLAVDGYNCAGESIKTCVIYVQPQPTVTAWQPQVLNPLVLGCDGSVYEAAQIEIVPQYSPTAADCPPVFMVNGGNNAIISLPESGTQTIVINYDGLDIPISVNVPYTQLEDNSLLLSADITHSQSDCGTDACSGDVQINVSETGSGQYSYAWSDGCQWHPYDPASGGGMVQNPNENIDDGGSPPDCNGAWHGNLCSGNYSVTVTDTQTGCTAVLSFAVGLYLQQGDLSVLTYPAFAEWGAEPDIRLVPALFDHSTKVRYTLPENGFVTIKVYNLQGILIETLVSNEYREAGSYDLNNEGGDYNNGMYLFSLEVCDRLHSKLGVKY